MSRCRDVMSTNKRGPIVAYNKTRKGCANKRIVSNTPWKCRERLYNYVCLLVGLITEVISKSRVFGSAALCWDKSSRGGSFQTSTYLSPLSRGARETAPQTKLRSVGSLSVCDFPHANVVIDQTKSFDWWGQAILVEWHFSRVKMKT